MDRNSETIMTWNKVAGIYEEKFMDFKLYDDTYDNFLALLPPGKLNILDAGCGPGNITRYLLNKRPDLSFLGIDASEEMVSLAARNNPKAEFQKLDIRSVRTLKRKFKAVIAGFCIPYLGLEEVRNFIIECNQVMDPDGILYMSFIEGPEERSGYLTGSTGDRMYINFYTSETIATLLEANGFSIFQINSKEFERNTETEYHTIVIAKSYP